MRKKNLLLGLLAASSALVLASCGGSNNSKASESSKAAEASSAAEASTVETGTETESSQNADVEKRNTNIQTFDDFDKDIDVSKLEVVYPTLRQGVMIGKAINTVNANTVSGYRNTINNEYYDGTLYESNTTFSIDAKFYNNDAADYTMKKNSTGNDGYYGPVVEIPALRELASASKAKLPYGNYTQSGTIAYNNNYIYNSSVTRSNYGTYNNNEIRKGTIASETASMLSSFNSAPANFDFYSIDEHHYLAKYSYESIYKSQVPVGYDSNNSDKIITETASYTYSSTFVCYLSYYENEFTVDYIYGNMNESSDYLYGYYSQFAVKSEEPVVYEGSEMEVVFSYNDNGDFEDKDSFISSFNNTLNATSVSGASYYASYDESGNITSISSNSSYGNNPDVISKDGNSVTYEFTLSMYDERLYLVNNTLTLSKVNEKVLKGEDLESSDSALLTSSYSVVIDYSNVELPEFAKVVTYDKNNYLTVDLESDNYYVLITNVTATYDAEKNEVTYVINSVDFIEMTGSSYAKVVSEKELVKLA